MRALLKIALASVAAAVVGCSDGPAATPSFPVVPVDATEVRPGGGDTVDRTDVKAFSQSNPLLGFAGEANFKAGNLLFRNTPAGLGPLFNTQSCQGCHNQDGRGSPPVSAEEPMVSMLLKVGILDAAAPGGVRPDPIYGDQLQTFGVAADTPSRGLPAHDGALPTSDAPEGNAIGEAYGFIEIEEIAGTYPDGEPFVLHRPTYKLRDLSYGPLDPSIALSPRVAQSMIGLGLLEAIPEEEIVARADPDDSDGDGISGRPNFVHDVLLDRSVLGRMGLKASQPSVLQQAATAYRGDIGITSSIRRTGPCTDAEPACVARLDDRPPAAGDFELADVQLALVEVYARQLAVPQRRGWDEATQTWNEPIGRGREVFQSIGCAVCHTPRHQTGEAHGSLLGEVRLNTLTQPGLPQPTLSNQTIWPYTDLLLHDMGGACEPTARETATGEPCDSGPECLWVRRCDGLADGMPDGEATGSEWRTPPLWGLGLVHVVNPVAGFLHDGRARSIEEAILWHGGEAEAVKRSFVELERSDREAILAFLESQ